VVGVLGIMAILGVTFFTMAQLERRASQRRVHQSRAFLLARSGIEDAMARLGSGQDSGVLKSQYLGEDWDAGGTLNGLEVPAEVFKRGALNQGDCPVAHALRPGWSMMDTLGRPVLVRVDGRDRGYSGRLTPAVAATTLTYSLKVEDESGKINVNGGFLDAGDRDNNGAGDGIPDHRDSDVRASTAVSDTGRGWNNQLTRTLNVLTGQLVPPPTNLASVAMGQRPAGGWPSIAALQAAVGTSIDLSQYLTTSSWTDSRVIHPNAFEGEVDQKLERRALGLEERGRPPVNLNAAPRQVLVALLQGLKGLLYRPSVAGPIRHAIEISPVNATAVANALITRRQISPFTTWTEFDTFLDGLVSSGTISSIGPADPSMASGNCGGADLIRAALNPNTLLNEQLPDQVLWHWVDKADLLAWSTEGSLGSTGTFRLTSGARVLDSRGRLLASAVVSSPVELFTQLRQSTQKDFVAGRTYLKDYLERDWVGASLNPVDRCTGASAGMAWWGGIPPMAGAQQVGATVMTYPCSPRAVVTGKAADFDGYVSLATLETAPLNPAAGALNFLHHFDDGWNADVGGAPSLTTGPWFGGANQNSHHQNDPAQSVWPGPPVEPSTLCPDGMRGESGRCPSYLAPGNVPADAAFPSSDHGVLSYWVKQPALSTYYWSYEFTCIRQSGAQTQFFATCLYTQKPGMLIENWAGTDGVGNNHEHGHQKILDLMSPQARWCLVTAFFDTDETVNGRDINYSIKGAVGAVGDQPYSLPFTSLETGTGQKLFVAGQIFTLGGPEIHEDFLATSKTADNILDEFAICDFTDVASTALVNSDAWALRRYNDGRYCKGEGAGIQEAGAFLSGLHSPAPGERLRLLSARWTEHLPTDPKLLMTNGSATLYPRLIDPLLAYPSGKSRLWLELELTDAAGNPLHPLVQGEAVSRILPAFRYRVRFKTDVDRSRPVLETPFFDDITFQVQEAGHPHVLGWGQGLP